MKTRGKIALLLAIGLFSGLFGCHAQKEPVPFPEETADIHFRSKAADLISAAIGPNAEVYAVSRETGVGLYTFDGDLLEEYPGTEHLLHLYCSGGLLYGYDYVTKNVVELNPQSGEIKVIYAGLPAAEVRSLTVTGGHILLIVVPSFETLDFDLIQSDDQYMDFGEKMMVIEIQSGELTERTDIVNPIALYQSADGTLYVYAHPANMRYVLYSYDTNTWKASQYAVMNDTGYLYRFAFESGCFVYVSTMNDIRIKRMSDELIYVGADVIPLIIGGGFAYHKGNVVFLEQKEPPPGEEEIVSLLRTLRLSRDASALLSIDGEGNIDGEKNQEPEANGDLVISAMRFDQVLSLNIMEQLSGIKGKYSPPPSNWDQYQEFLTSIMAGDDRIDIYILRSFQAETRAMREQGGYVSLVESEPVQMYLDQCFDWVGDAARTAGGDIWALPLYFDASALWYVPENFSRFGLTAADVADVDGYLETVERLNGIKGDYSTHMTAFVNQEIYWFWQYQMTYCDYPNGKAAFSTPLFHEYFESMWSGWNLYESNFRKKPAHHPVLQYDQELYWEDFSNGMSNDYDIERVILKLDGIEEHLRESGGLSGWRVLPLPRLSGDVDSNYSLCVFAIVNPYSRNKERAVAYLTAAAQDMQSAVTRPLFVQKELSAYEGVYDMTLPVYLDLYEFFRDGKVVADGVDRLMYNPVIREYQAGNFTLQQAVAELQRRAEMWLHE